MSAARLLQPLLARFLRWKYQCEDPGFPPPWLRHVTPWGLLIWLDRTMPDLCWTALVCWKVMGSEWDWFQDFNCVPCPGRGDCCYCGKVRTPEPQATVEASR